MSRNELEEMQGMTAEHVRLIPWPSDALIEAHRKNGGRWMARNRWGWLCFGRFSKTEERNVERQVYPGVAFEELGGGRNWGYQNTLENWLFWPVDAVGNKVPLPKEGT